MKRPGILDAAGVADGPGVEGIKTADSTCDARGEGLEGAYACDDVPFLLPLLHGFADGRVTEGLTWRLGTEGENDGSVARSLPFNDGPW